MDVKIEKISKADEDAVIEFLKNTFFKDEPLNSSLDLGECKPLEHFCKKTLDSGFSFKAVDPVTGEIVGANLCLRLRNDEQPDVEEEKLYKTHEKFFRIMEISEYAYERIDLFGRYPNCLEMVQAEVLSVHRAYRGRGLGTKLFDASVNEATAAGVPVFYCQCSSDFAAKAAVNLNFTEVFSIAYEHFKKDGVQTLNPNPPHDYLKVFIKWLGPVPK